MAAPESPAAFSAALDAAIARATQAGSALTDAHMTLPYAELPALFSSMDDTMRGGGVSAESCLAFVCPQGALAAATILYLLERGLSFVLIAPDLPDEAEVLDGLNLCTHRLGVQDSASPHAALQLTPAPASTQRTPDPRPRLYMRTSGSLGRSKLVEYTHDDFIGNADAARERFGLQPTDRVALPVPISHMYGLGAALIPGALAGASFDLQPQANILRYMDRERAFNPNVAFLSPSLCGMFVKRRRSPRPHRLVVTAGARIDEELFGAFDQRFGPLVNLYGSSEMGAVSACRLSDPVATRKGSIGVPMRGMELRLGDDNAGTGELWVRSAHGFLGYVDGEGASMLRASEWFQTHDLATRSAEGNLRILGRADNAVNRDGRLVMFADIERKLERLPGVQQAVVVRAPGEGPRGPRITAWCVIEAGDSPASDTDARALRAACSTVLPRYATPDSLQTLAALPLLPSGKVDRRRLTQLAREQT